MNKDFNVKDFVEEYEKQTNDTDKAKFIKTKLKCEKYMPYAEKLMIADNIIQSSSYKMENVDGVLNKTDKIAINSPMRYILFVMTVVNKYTNIEVNFNGIMPEFDYLNQNSLIEVIFEKIGEKEINEFNTVVDMVLNDFVSNKFEIKNYISDMFSRVYNLAEKCIPLVDNIASKLEDMSEEDIERLSKMFERVTKFVK